MQPKRLVVIIFTIFLVFATGLALSSGTSHEIFLRANAASISSCEAVLTKAIDLLQTSCGKLGRNKACYGNDKVKAEPSGDAGLTFDKAGDTAAIQTIKTIETAPLDLTTGVWGLSVLKLQANLPDSLPGQNVTFLVYGNTHIDNTTGDMQGFYFSSGLGTPECKETPADGIVVKSPNHTTVTFTANGVQITIASTIKLRAEPNKSMDVTLIEGHATVSNAAGSQVLQPGQSVSIPMGGINGLSPVDAPSKPVKAQSDKTLETLVDAAVEMSGDPEDGGKGTKPAPPPQRNYPTKPAQAGGNGNGNDGTPNGGNGNGSGNGNGNGNGAGGGNGNGNGGGGGGGNGNGNGAGAGGGGGAGAGNGNGGNGNGGGGGNGNGNGNSNGNGNGKGNG